MDFLVSISASATTSRASVQASQGQTLPLASHAASPGVPVRSRAGSVAFLQAASNFAPAVLEASASSMPSSHSLPAAWISSSQ